MLLFWVTNLTVKAFLSLLIVMNDTDICTLSSGQFTQKFKLLGNDMPTMYIKLI